MRSRLASLLFLLLSSLVLPGTIAARVQACTGLCLQQVSCPNGATTSISGVVSAPNGVDPLPGVLVYIPNAAVAAFSPGVSCAVAGQPPSGSPLVGTTTAVNGAFTLTNVPVGTNIPFVVQSGRWRREVVVPATAACASTAFSTSFPQTQAQGDIPKIAVISGQSDAVECVLRKVGLSDAEFTDPGGSGRVNLYLATGTAGAQIDPQTPTGDTLLGNAAALSAYDVLMLPCEGSAFLKPPDQLGNLVQYANAGGRVYASHFSYDWLYNNPPFNTVVNWAPNQQHPPDGTATVDTSFVQGQTLSQWLVDVGASTTAGKVPINTLRRDLNGVNPPTQTWLTLDNGTFGNPVMQFTFDTPVNATTQACGRVLFNEYHVENPSQSVSRLTFPAECTPGPMTAQEKLLEFSLFDLTGDGSPPSLSPLDNDFGTEAVGSTTGSQQFVWTNNTIFPVTVTAATVSGDFHLTGNTCANVAVGASCTLSADFSPTALGPRTGSLTVTANTGTLSAALTGNAVSPLAISSPSVGFGKVDVGATATQTITVSNVTGAAIPVPISSATGDFSTATTCGSSLAPVSSCSITITFSPTATGQRTGTLTVGAFTGTAVASAGTPLVSTDLTGTGVDFAEAMGPTNAQTVAGLSTTATSTTSPIAGFSNPITVDCTTTAPASVCTLATGGFTPATAIADAVTITTTSQYAVVGYSGLGGGVHRTRRGLLVCLIVLGSTLLLRRRRGSAARLGKVGMLLLSTAILASALSGCSGKLPAQNAPFTPAGTYTYTVAATDGFLKHSATYTLIVTAQ